MMCVSRCSDEPFGEHIKEAYTCTWHYTAEAPTKSLTPLTAPTNTAIIFLNQ
jgi:hypothetical protein